MMVIGKRWEWWLDSVSGKTIVMERLSYGDAGGFLCVRLEDGLTHMAWVIEPGLETRPLSHRWLGLGVSKEFRRWRGMTPSRRIGADA